MPYERLKVLISGIAGWISLFIRPSEASIPEALAGKP